MWSGVEGANQEEEWIDRGQKEREEEGVKGGLSEGSLQ